MADICAACGSGDTGAMADTYVCHNCGAVTSYRNREVVVNSTTEPVEQGPLVTTVSPADVSDPDNPTRIRVSQGPGDPVALVETIDADPGRVARVAVVGTDEYDQMNAPMEVVSVDPIVGSDGDATQERDAPNPGVLGDTPDPDGPTIGPLADEEDVVAAQPTDENADDAS